MELHPQEDDRLESLRSYGVLDSGRDPAYDDLTALAALVCGTPMALISLVDADRQWFKSSLGLDLAQTRREDSFCSHAVAAAAPLVVGDAHRDPRFADNPLVNGEPWVRAYAGVPLVGRDGLPLGTLCTLDTRARRFTSAQLGALGTLADQVTGLLEQDRADRARGIRVSRVPGELTNPVRLRAALDDGELVPWFQPMVDLATGQPRGLEALLRWEHPELGVLSPDRFLPAVESTGLMLPVGRHVLRESLRHLAELRHLPATPLIGVAVNVSLTQLATPGLAATVAEELDALDVPPAHLSVELTESAALHDDGGAVRELHALRELGVHLAVDDYGTGYSALMRVLDLPITALKLDRSLVRRLPGDRRAVAVAGSTLDMAETLGLGVVAEGIEERAQSQALLDLGCAYGQGFLYSRPLPAAQVSTLLQLAAA